MLTDDQRKELLKAVDSVCNRDASIMQSPGMVIERVGSGNILIRLNAVVLDLEPLSEDSYTDDPRHLGGVGWPE